ncbi:MAG: Ig-like domain-containing protein, partial [Candidatus Magasanikbacteria bacterium]|nr:Ig-like domain-containing protein [Candidatus Magasanikbacteria bacterium]
EVCPGEGVRCCAGGSCNTSCPEDSTFKSSMFAWSFSSGRFPVVPKVVEQCGKYCVGTSKACNSNADCNNETPDTAKNCQPVTPSPSPAVRWPNSNAVCINAAVKVLFDTTITNNGATLAPANAQDILHVYKCVNGDSNCLLNNAGQVVAGTYNIFAEGSGNGINFSPTANFATGTTYQVVVTTDAGSALGVLFSKMSEDSSCPKINTVFPNKKSAYCFKFNTNSSDCGGITHCLYHLYFRCYFK